MNRYDIIEFLVLIGWACAFVYCMLRGIDPGLGVATAFASFVGACAVKVTFGA